MGGRSGGRTIGGADDREGEGADLPKVELKVCLAPRVKALLRDEAHGMGVTVSALVELLALEYCGRYRVVYEGPRPPGLLAILDGRGGGAGGDAPAGEGGGRATA